MRTVSVELATDGFPFGHCLPSVIADLIGGRFCVIWNKEITDGGKQRNEVLQASDRSESLSHSFPFSKGNMGVLGPVVQALV
jgi:hypothetical protein